MRYNLGYGSSAVVYGAIYKPLNKRVALKMIDLDMFERNQIDELRVSHPILSCARVCVLVLVCVCVSHTQNLLIAA